MVDACRLEPLDLLDHPSASVATMKNHHVMSDKVCVEFDLLCIGNPVFEHGRNQAAGPEAQSSMALS